MNLEDYIIKPDISVIDAIKAIDKSREGIVYVCDSQHHLIGAVTDGDIRRHILRDGNLNIPVNMIMTADPIKLYVSNRTIADEYMTKYSITSVPVVDDEDKIQEIFFWDTTIHKTIRQISSPVVIMAGGKGTRLAPYTQILPKPLIPIGEKTITEHIIERFMNVGCRRFDIVVNYKRHLIQSYFKDIKTSSDIRFFEEDKYLGTAGGLRLLIGQYNEPFFMTNCDIIVEDDYSKIMSYHKKNNNLITIVSALKNTTLPYGIIETSGDGIVTSIKEKPEISNIVNTGLYILNPDFLDIIPKDCFIHITDVIKMCIDRGDPVRMYPISGDKWWDMGQMDELQIMSRRIMNN